jgi:hypothetical protein
MHDRHVKEHRIVGTTFESIKKAVGSIDRPKN